MAASVMAILSSSAYAENKPKKNETVVYLDINKLIWPTPPDITRVVWQSAMSGEEDLNPGASKKRKTSWMDKMAGVTLPSESGKPRLRKPYGVAVDSKGLIYVADSPSGAVLIFDLENRKVKVRGAQELAKPAGVALDDSDRLFVSDVAQRAIFVYKPDGGLEMSFGADRLLQPAGLAIDNENRFLYVVDGGLSRLAVFDADTYKFLRYLGRKSDPNVNAPGTFDRPSFAAIDNDGNLYVTDTFNARVQVFDADGNFLRMWGKPGNTAGHFMRPKGIAIDGDNHVHVLDAEYNNVQMFDTEGNTLMFFGDRGYAPGTFTLAAGLAIDKYNRIIVTEQWTGRMQIFRYITDKEAAPAYEMRAKAAAEKAAEEAAARKAAEEKVRQAAKQ